MFVVIMLRNGEAHIVNNRLGDGGYRTVCYKAIAIRKDWTINTIAADDTFPGLCQKCKTDYDEMYLSDLNEEPTMARNETQMKYEDIVEFNRRNYVGARVLYEDVAVRRWWPKLIKYQRLPQRRK